MKKRCILHGRVIVMLGYASMMHGKFNIQDVEVRISQNISEDGIYNFKMSFKCEIRNFIAHYKWSTRILLYEVSN